MFFFSSLFFLLIVLFGIVTFTNMYTEAAEEEISETCRMLFDVVNHDSRTDLCMTEFVCGDDTKKLTYRESVRFENNILKHDYLVSLFLEKYPGNDLETIIGPNRVNNSRPHVWIIDDNPVGKLYVNFDRCHNIVEYSVVMDDIHITATYPFDDTISNNITVYEKDRYDLVKNLLGRHPPPKIQISEFGVWPDKIKCNESQDLYKQDGGNNYRNSGPTCLTLQAYQEMLKSGVNLSRYDDPKNTQCGESLELYRRGDTDGSGNGTPVCLTSQTYGKLLKRGMELGRYGDE